MNKRYTQLGAMVGAIGLLLVSSLCKITWGIGSYYCSFSALSVVAPLLVLYAPLSGFALSLGVFAGVKMILTGSLFIPLLTTCGLPSLVAGTFLKLQSRASYTGSRSWRHEIAKAALSLGVPLVAMVLFFIHPVGYGAFPYTFYWLIPVAFYVLEKAFNHSSVFGAALSSTFLAHAVGSVIYLYRFSFTAEAWLSLIPAVAAERLVIASGMVLCMVLYSYGKKYALVLMNVFKQTKHAQKAS